MILKISLLIIAFISINNLIYSQNCQQYNVEEARNYVTNYNYERDMFSGGDTSMYVYLHLSEVITSTVIDRAGPIKELPVKINENIPSFITKTSLGNLNLKDYIDSSTVDAMVVVHHGNIVYETYPRMQEFEKHHIMSVGKVFASAIIGIMESKGQIDVRQPVSYYLEALKGSDWDKVKIIDVLDMSTGICHFTCDGFWETYDDPAKDLKDILEFYAEQKAHRPPGEIFEYSNPATILLGILIEHLTNQKYADVLGELIWRPIGAEGDLILGNHANLRPNMVGHEAATARDMARFGMLYTPSGRNTENPIVPGKHLYNIQHGGRPEIFKNTPRMDMEILDVGSDQNLVDGELPDHNTYQWDVVMKDGDFYKGGFRGQGLYVSPDRDLVIVFFSHQTNEMGRISRQLAKSGIFDN